MVLIVAYTYERAKFEAKELGLPATINQKEWRWGDPRDPHRIMGLEFKKIIWCEGWEQSVRIKSPKGGVDVANFFQSRVR